MTAKAVQGMEENYALLRSSNSAVEEEGVPHLIKNDIGRFAEGRPG